jgi:diguanylate cyclase (GGDEF)-like protein/PAS domain S-box-containing protein
MLNLIPNKGYSGCAPLLTMNSGYADTCPGCVTRMIKVNQQGNDSHNARLMLDAIRQAQSRFIVEANPRHSFEVLLEVLLSLTESEYGFIGEVFRKPDGIPYLKEHAITNISWNEETRTLYEKHAKEGLEFHNLKTLFGAVLTTSETVIANDPANDPRSGGLPPGHPAMHCFMGLPIFSNEMLIGMIGVANRPGGYTQELAAWLEPVLSTCSTLITAFQNARKKKQAEQTLSESESRFREIFNTANDAIFIHDAETGAILDVNQRMCEMYGYTHDEALLCRPDDLSSGAPPYSAAEAISKIQLALTEGPQTFEWLARARDGHLFWVEVGLRLATIGNRQVTLAAVRDINARKQTETELRIASVAFESHESMIITDINGTILRVNHAFIESTGYSAEEAIGQTPRILKSGRHDVNFYRAMWDTLIKTGKWQGEVWDRRKNGEIFPKWLTISAVKGADGTVSHYVGSHIDISESKAAQEEIKNLAFYDSLTQLPNRRLLIDRLQQALASSGRDGRAGALMFIDIDHFKVLNDTLGHTTGDMLLQQVARRLGSCIREGDTVSRLGGDEFVVMLEGLSRQPFEAAAQVESLGEKILAALNQPYQLASHEHHSTSSIGATVFHGNKHEIEDLLKQADIAMYQAKKAGRNTLRFFDSQMQDAINARAVLEGELRKALNLQQFQLHYQVQVDSSLRPLGAEALIRWMHPERGMVSPVEFIPLAEETGLILPIGRWVLDSACAQLKAWQANTLTSGLVLSVNVSATEFRQASFMAQVQASLRLHGINPALLKLELTEGMLVENMENAIETMHALKKTGIQFSLDDFGTGYSSLQYLKRLPLDQLKIDQSFIRNLGSSNSDQAIVRTIIAMAASLNLEIIAEGVETEEQQQFLKDKGCSQYQGYLFGKPVPIGQFEAALKQGPIA